MASIADRIEEILGARGVTGRELARRCGFRTDSQVNNTLARLRERPLAVEVDTLAQIAAGAGVHLDWLLTGKGPRDVTDAAPADRYPNRTEAVATLAPSVEAGVIEREAIDNVTGWDLYSATDREVRWWVAQILDENQRVRARVLVMFEPRWRGFAPPASRW